MIIFTAQLIFFGGEGGSHVRFMYKVVGEHPFSVLWDLGLVGYSSIELRIHLSVRSFFEMLNFCT